MTTPEGCPPTGLQKGLEDPMVAELRAIRRELREGRARKSVGGEIIVATLGTVVGGVLLALFLWFVPWASLGIQTGTIPAIEAAQQGSPAPYLTYSGSAIVNHELIRPTIVSGLDIARDCVRLTVTNAGTATAADATIVFDNLKDPISIRAWGDVRWMNASGVWFPVTERPTRLSDTNRSVRLSIPTLHPGERVEVHLLTQRATNSEFAWPVFDIRYSGGQAQPSLTSYANWRQ